MHFQRTIPLSGFLYLVFLTLAGLIFALYEAWAWQQVKPASPNMTITEFSSQMPSPQKLAIVEHDGVRYIVWIGRYPRSIVPASGPPCYVFDADGKLVDWSLDTGDDHKLAHFFDEASWKEDEVNLESLLIHSLHD